MHTAGADETGGERGATGEQLEPARPGGGGATSNGATSAMDERAPSSCELESCVQAGFAAEGAKPA